MGHGKVLEALARRWRFVLALAAVATFPLGTGSFGIPTFQILSPLANQLSLAGTIHAAIRLPKAAVAGLW